jgi:hypothetical protein
MKNINSTILVLFALVFLFQITETFGQTRLITGKVFNSETNEPIPDIKITIKGTDFYTKSNKEGEYSLVTPESMDTLVFADFAQMNVAEIKSISLDNIDIYLSPKGIFDLSLEELMGLKVKSSTKSNIRIQRAPSSIKVFKQRDFEKYGFYTLQDILIEGWA